jgi:hypothetical protein
MMALPNGHVGSCPDRHVGSYADTRRARQHRNDREGLPQATATGVDQGRRTMDGIFRGTFG